MQMKELLPVGTVVLRNDNPQKIMIVGVMQKVNGIDWDYLAVPYPEGYIGQEFRYFLNHEEIAEVVFRGCDGEEQSEFVKKLEGVYGETIQHPKTSDEKPRSLFSRLFA